MRPHISTPQAIAPGQWIGIGERAIVHAVVCVVRGSSEPMCEVVYLDDRIRAINEDVVWKGQYWEFLQPDVRGGYADQYDRLREYVAILRRGRVTG